jgi:cobalamin biosynthesis Mg chelatase CobN
LFLSASHRTVHRSPISHRALRIGIALAVVVIVAGLGARAATAAAAASTKSCADQVIADWYDDGKVSKIYPLQCYRDAIKKLPPDVRQYSNAAEEIARALAFAKQGKQDPGGNPSTDTTTTTAVTSTQDTATEQTTTTKTTKTNTQKTGTTPTIDTATIETTTADTSGPSSVPVPLLVLGGLAVLLLAAGSAGYLRRRMNGDEGDGTPPADPPVA